jgi:hypothetical protein
MFAMNTCLRHYRALLSVCAAACLLTACVTTGHESLRASAARLNDASSHFSAQLQYQGDDSRRGLLSRDAEALAKAAHNLDRVLSNGNTRLDVEDEYRRVSDNYEQLHVQLADEGYAAQNRQVLTDFDRVTTAYRNVEAAMGLRTASAR